MVFESKLVYVRHNQVINVCISFLSQGIIKIGGLRNVGACRDDFIPSLASSCLYTAVWLLRYSRQSVRRII
jgi:hypothetical protein